MTRRWRPHEKNNRASMTVLKNDSRFLESLSEIFQKNCYAGKKREPFFIK